LGDLLGRGGLAGGNGGSDTIPVHSAASDGPQWQRCCRAQALASTNLPDSQNRSLACPFAKHRHVGGEGAVDGDGAGDRVVVGAWVVQVNLWDGPAVEAVQEPSARWFMVEKPPVQDALA